MREENLIILKMFQENPDAVGTADVLKSMEIYSKEKTLEKDQTTEMLSLRGLSRDEFDLFAKILDVIGLQKKT